MSCAIVIPARMASTRFPGKPLVDLCGKPMVQWVVEAARAANLTDQIVVATPDAEILEACHKFGTKAVLTRDDHASGTDRLAEVAQQIQAEVYVNLQGDEPLIDPQTILACAKPLLEDPSVMMGSIYSPCSEEEMSSNAVVKVVLDRKGFALYFSRHPIPYVVKDRHAPALRHIGIYAFRRETLLSFASWPAGALEKTESLEQLRFLENGVRIKMSLGAGSPISVDLPEHADQARKFLATLGSINP
jgi:3-deoxy-D-manno-octulosonate cytidylyltransferase